MTEDAPPDPEETVESAEEPPDEPGRTCATCGSPLDPAQLYCLECGSPSELAPELRRPRRAGPLVAAGLIGLGLVGGAAAFAIVNDDDEPRQTEAPITVETTDTVPELPATTDGGLPPDPGAPPATDGVTDVTGPEDGSTETDVAPVTPPADPIDEWPVGRDGWTVFVSSVTDGAEAQGTKDRVQALGEEAGLLFSSNYQGLRAGYWVVYSGIYSTRAEAVEQADLLAPDFPGANARQVTPP